jgi:hypothetical protein
LVCEHDLPLLVDRARAMAVAIPDARLVLLADSPTCPCSTSPRPHRELDRFLAGL